MEAPAGQVKGKIPELGIEHISGRRVHPSRHCVGLAGQSAGPGAHGEHRKRAIHHRQHRSANHRFGWIKIRREMMVQWRAQDDRSVIEKRSTRSTEATGLSFSQPHGCRTRPSFSMR